ncbi:MAG: hypothetical protein ACI837_002961 [Crocinitomicaceae bacterium]|jgi:hypothetical protein
MKTIFYPIIACLLVACSTESEPIPEVPTVESFTKTYVGTIDAKYPIVMKLTSEAGAVTGMYFYNSNGTDMTLKGTIDHAQTLSLDEFNQDGKKTGTFSGQIIDDKITGQWTNPDLSKILDFSLTETPGDYDAIQAKTRKKNEFKSPIVSATYYGYNEGDDHSQLTIKRISDVTFEFYLGVGNEWCDGELEGKVTINKQGLGIFNSEGCENLMFQFEKDGVQVTEGESCDYHGARCSFEEFYEKDGVPI